MTLIANPFCTAAQLAIRFGSAALIDWADHDNDGVADDGVIDEAINRATSKIAARGRQRYSTTVLKNHAEVQGWAVTIGGYLLSQTRGNPPPETLAREYEEIIALLLEVQAGTYWLADVALSADLRPSMSNVQVDRRYRQRTIRVQRESSTDAVSSRRQDFKDDIPVAP